MLFLRISDVDERRGAAASQCLCEMMTRDRDETAGSIGSVIVRFSHVYTYVVYR